MSTGTGRWLLLLWCAAPGLTACSEGSVGGSSAGESGSDGAAGTGAAASSSSQDTAASATVGAGGTTGGGGDSTSASSGSPGDPYDADRALCVAHINELRATKGLPPFTRWVEGEACADLQVTDDSQTMIAHNAWKTDKFGCDGGASTNECPGWGGPPCIDAMWAESSSPDCSNCDNCRGDYGCDGCDFYGTTTGTVCGHYENLSAKSYTLVACGFGGGWMQLNFK
ncbi:MAG: hypothetical protein WKG00_03825 [Polyangiaceae bacterium]